MTNNNDWKEKFNKEFSHVGWIPENKQHILDFISQNFISLSSLEKFIEENKREINPFTKSLAEEVQLHDNRVYNSALNLLDKFIHE